MRAATFALVFQLGSLGHGSAIEGLFAVLAPCAATFPRSRVPLEGASLDASRDHSRRVSPHQGAQRPRLHNALV